MAYHGDREFLDSGAIRIPSARDVNSDNGLSQLREPCKTVRIDKSASFNSSATDSQPNYNLHASLSSQSCKSFTKHSGDEAFQSWLSNKSKKLTIEASMRKKQEEDKRKIEEERKRKAEAEYDQWLKKKQAEKYTQPTTFPIPKARSGNSPGSRSSAPSTRINVGTQEMQARLEAWERKKILEKKKQELVKRQETETKREKEEQRRKMASQAWESWAANASKKPKPVPLNRGFFSLRGTVSNIYINPNEWQSILPEDNQK